MHNQVLPMPILFAFKIINIECSSTGMEEHQELKNSFELLKATMASKKTASSEFKKEQLNQFIKMLTDEGNTINEAIYKDLKKEPGDVMLSEILLCTTEARHAISNLDSWMGKQYAGKRLASMLDTAYIRKDPKGVALIIAPWNIPLQMCLSPMVSLIASGCVGIVKPSEMAPCTSACIKCLLKNIWTQVATWSLKVL